MQKISSHEIDLRDAEHRLQDATDSMRRLHSARPLQTISSGKSPLTSETIERILFAADNVFKEYGHGGLSLRKVAREANIAVGNLTYHFRTRDILLKAVLEERCAKFAAIYSEIASQEKLTPLEKLENIIRIYINDSYLSKPLNFQIWGYVAADEEAHKALSDFYKAVSKMNCALISLANPKLTAKQCAAIAFQIASITDGARAMVSLGVEQSDTISLDVDFIVETIMASIKADY